MCVSSSVGSGGGLGSCSPAPRGLCPGHRQVIAAAEALEVLGHEVLNPLQVSLVGALGTIRAPGSAGSVHQSQPKLATPAVIDHFDIAPAPRAPSPHG
jgi:hypothetical protein